MGATVPQHAVQAVRCGREGAIHNGDSRVTSSGTLAIDTIGLTGSPGGLRLDNAADWAQLATVDSVTEVWIRFRVSSAASRQLPQCTIDGGATQTVPDTSVPAGTTAATYWHKITGLSSGTHTIRVLGQTVASKFTDVVGWYTRNNPGAAGVAVHRLGADGGFIGPALPEETGQAGGLSKATVFHDSLAPDLMVIAFGSNEAGTGGAADGWTLARYEAALRANIEFANSRGCDVLLMSVGRADPATRGEDEGAYFALHEALAAEYSYVAQLDIGRAWGTYAEATAAGLLSDWIHPNIVGHSDMAQLMYDALVNL